MKLQMNNIRIIQESFFLRENCLKFRTGLI